ncbi:hypothetical protein DdX_12332 [Ditylenchus destructor]|uniref:ShKT domain-containing protein n=1 Tax=Ditylenchus destructor TaxID=166010 RepID=A0AAD4R3W6_9BILA|nr:hypothetical protein DdX_12332 [Ditylenchus destructor]
MAEFVYFALYFALLCISLPSTEPSSTEESSSSLTRDTSEEEDSHSACMDRLNPRTGVSDCQANIRNCNPAFMGGIWIIVMKQECPKACKDAGFHIFDPNVVDC